ncbi:hypothetical protein SDC9_61691 [bioreactor metagenome]|uniref:Uncharacterized protein n=1 Tax=bioreactor metagenome TaxID=1076179 RepID=A0A644XM51_9ZZZZ
MAKEVSQQLFTISFGGWYQRTTLHLSEIYELFSRGCSRLPLSVSKLSALYQNLNFESVTRENGDLEFVHAITKDGIELKYYEDGLYVLTIKSKDIAKAHQKLEDYYNQNLAPAISYIFSLGAPTPKVLADIKIVNPVVVYCQTSKFDKSIINEDEMGQIYSQLSSGDCSVYKTSKYIFIAAGNSFQKSHELVEMQIFFREFKDQLERYLNIHRTIWEEIQNIKERPMVKGKNISKLREKLDVHQKTINLISSRIDQMSSYIGTRSSIASSLKIEDDLNSLFQYKFQTLSNTHAYIQQIWVMTKEYLDSAIQIISDVQSQNSDKTIESLRLITTIGVLSGIIDYFSVENFPSPTFIGISYFIGLVFATWLINKIITYVYSNIKYKLEFTNNKT